MVATVRITPRQLLDHLASTGRIVFPRVLSDWRAKGLLPKLKGTGRGRGPGKLQYWDNPDVLGQAVILYDTMAIKRRTDYAHWVLWFCGYDVDPEKVRAYWLAQLDATHLQRKKEPSEFPSDKYIAEFGPLADSLSRKLNWDLQIAEPIAREFYVSANEAPNTPVNEDEFQELFTATRRLFREFSRSNKIKISLTQSTLRELLALYRSFGSAVALKQTLATIAAAELCRAQGYLRTLGALLAAFAVASQNEQLDEFQYLQIRRQFSPIFGRFIFEAFLLVMNSGQEAILLSAEAVVLRIIDNLKLGGMTPPISETISANFDELSNVLSDLDYNRLYKSAP